MGLVILVPQGGSSEANNFALALGAALSRAGFNVTSDPQAHADVALRPSVSVSPTMRCSSRSSTAGRL